MRPQKNKRCAPRFLREFFAGLFLAATLNLYAQQDTTLLRLDDVLSRMDTSYPALLQYSQKLRAIEASAQGAKSWMPPTVSVGMERFGYRPRMWSEESPMNQAAVMVSAEQMFPNPAKLDSRSNAILAQAAPLRYDSAWMKNSLRADARFYYYRRVMAERKLALLQESASILDMLISAAEARYAVNQADLSTIFKARARRAELANMETMLRAQIAESNIGINTLMNRDLSTPFRVDTVTRLISLPALPFSDSLQKRSDLLAVDASIYAMRREQAAMRAGLRPDFGVRVSHMQMLGMPNQFSVMGMLVIPVAPWSSGMYRSEVRAMEYRISDMQLEKQNMQLMARRMAAEQLVMLRSETQQLHNYDSLIVPAYQDNYDAAFLAYQNNTGSFFVLLDAWDMLLMKKLEAADQLYKVLVLQTQYEYETEQ